MIDNCNTAAEIVGYNDKLHLVTVLSCIDLKALSNVGMLILLHLSHSPIVSKYLTITVENFLTFLAIKATLLWSEVGGGPEEGREEGALAKP